MDTSYFLGGTGVFLSVAGIIYSAVNHKHIRSRCCGKELDFSIDIESTTDDKTGASKEPSPKKEEKKEEKKDGTGLSYFKLKPRVLPHIDIP